MNQRDGIYHLCHQIRHGSHPDIDLSQILLIPPGFLVVVHSIRENLIGHNNEIPALFLYMADSCKNLLHTVIPAALLLVHLIGGQIGHTFQQHRMITRHICMF